MARSDYTTYHIDTYFGDLAYHVKGDLQGSSVYIFFHGHVDTAMENGNYVIFDKNYADAMQVMLDFRWHGASTRLEFYPKMSERAEDIDILITDITARFPNLKRIYLVGYSQGGSAIIYYLTNKFLTKNKITSAFLLAPRVNLKSYLKWFERNALEMEEKGLNRFSKKYKSKGFINFNREFINEFSTLDFGKLIKNLETLTYFVRGQQDDVLGEDETMNFLEKSGDRIEYYEITDCGHYPTDEQWQEINDFIFTITNS